jgi:hypothetical protein
MITERSGRFDMTGSGPLLVGRLLTAVRTSATLK